MKSCSAKNLQKVPLQLGKLPFFLQKREAPQPNEHKDIGRMAEKISKIANGGGGDEADAARGTRKQEKVREGGLQTHTPSFILLW